MNVMFQPAVLPRSGPCRTCRGGLLTRQRGLVPSGGAKNTRAARFSRISWNLCSARAGTNTTLPGRARIRVRGEDRGVRPGYEHEAPGSDLAILSPHSNSRAAPDDIVHLILGVGRLLVFAASGEFVQAATHRRD